MFKLGAANGTDCPDNMVEMKSEAACQSAAAAAGNPYGGNMMALYVPGGCHWLTVSGTFYFNEEATGGGNDLARPVCAGAPDSQSIPMGTMSIQVRLLACALVRWNCRCGRTCVRKCLQAGRRP